MSMRVCAFINSRKECSFERKLKYMCPILYQGFNIECFDLPVSSYERMQNIYDNYLFERLKL
jgi:hypothetical protein